MTRRLIKICSKTPNTVGTPEKAFYNNLSTFFQYILAIPLNWYQVCAVRYQASSYVFSLLLFMSCFYDRGLDHQRPQSPNLHEGHQALCLCRSPVILPSDLGIFPWSAFCLQSVCFRSSLSGLEFDGENRSHVSHGSSCPPDSPLAHAGSSSSPFPVTGNGLRPPRDGHLLPEGRSGCGSSSLPCAQPLTLYQMLPGDICIRLL